MRETSNKQICLVQGGKDAVGITNTSTGFNSSTVIAEITALCAAAKAKVKTGFKFAIVNVTDGDARFGTDPSVLGEKFLEFSNNLRTATGNPNLHILMVGLGEDTDPVAYESWTPHREYFKRDYKNEYGDNNFHFIQTDDLPAATYCEADGIHWNALGHKTIARRITYFLMALGVIPYDKTINVCLSGQSNTGALGNSTESSSTVGIDAVISKLEAYYPDHAINYYKGTDGGSGTNEVTNAAEYHWDRGNDRRGIELQDFFDGLTIRPDYIYHCNTATDANSSETAENLKADMLNIFNEYYSVHPKTKIILRNAGRRPALGNTGGFQKVRELQWDLAAGHSNILLSRETYSKSLHDTVHVADSDLDEEGEDLAEIIAYDRGLTIDGGVYGGKITSWSIDNTTITLGVTLEAGTALTPTSGIEGFRLFDQNGEIVPTSVNSTGATITIELPSTPVGNLTVYYGYDAMTELHNDVSGTSVISANIVRDNSAQTMPLQTAKISL